mmetsp:Transcript_42391/g.127078  ORF Transcript_42391/g.127078 Transcript_42391/m.127078 type:complete len:201 (+) Transcript_42391:2262-2864(+)
MGPPLRLMQVAVSRRAARQVWRMEPPHNAMRRRNTVLQRPCNLAEACRPAGRRNTVLQSPCDLAVACRPAGRRNTALQRACNLAVARRLVAECRPRAGSTQRTCMRSTACHQWTQTRMLQMRRCTAIASNGTSMQTQRTCQHRCGPKRTESTATGSPASRCCSACCSTWTHIGRARTMRRRSFWTLALTLGLWCARALAE